MLSKKETYLVRKSLRELWILMPVGPCTVSPEAVEPTRSRCVSYCRRCRKDQVPLFYRRRSDDD